MYSDNSCSFSVLSMVMTQRDVTALYFASARGDATVVRLLLEKGADVNIRNEVVMDFVSGICMSTFSQLTLCYACMYVQYESEKRQSL